MTRPVVRAAREASTIAYVTERVLQEKYPANPDAFATYYSSVELGDSAFSQPRLLPPARPRTLITVGSLDQTYKGVDTIIRALNTLRQAGLDARLVVVGDGRLRASYVALAEECGLSPHVTFVGEVAAGEDVRRQLDKADVFVLASLTEGLPRAMIEAMARGLPCVGSCVGGIPELLSEDRLFEPRSVDQLARVLTDLLTNPDEYAQESRRMIEVARDYEGWRLEQRRREHYARLATLAAAWQSPQGRVR
jgi:glycosyltransferase involved in cell wall biosynthesis